VEREEREEEEEAEGEERGEAAVDGSPIVFPYSLFENIIKK
jgi:hypothetical protein